MAKDVDDILRENERRLAVIAAPFDPITGKGSVGKRFRFALPDYPLEEQWLPVSMKSVPLIKKLTKAGSIERFLTDVLQIEDTESEHSKVVRKLIRLRCRHDFPFWAAMFVYIKNKGGGEDVRFRLTLPQRKFVATLEEKRLASLPIRLILLKARQWGGSTTSQLYMAWLQLVHKVGLNSLIIAHQGAGSDEIKDMFDRMIKRYPVEMLHEMGDTYAANEPKIVGVGKSGNISRVPQRNCKIKIGTAERPDSCRGGDYNLVHLSEVGIWKKTDGKSPEDIVASACSGILLEPYTMIVYESTAKGVGNFFHNEYVAAKKGKSQFEAAFVSWFDIPKYSLPFHDRKGNENEAARKLFANRLWQYRNDDSVSSNREESGKYLWWLWETCGATLEAIHWYVLERSGKSSHGQMASEYPSDDIEAFVHAGGRVFDKYQIEELRPCCRAPKWKGEVFGKTDDGPDALKNLRFSTEQGGGLWVWSKPEADDGDEIITDRYLVSVDIGGRSDKADWSVICVFDRLFMMDKENPVVVAQWYGHTDIDLLAWKAAQIAAWYNNALLVIESNTLETHDKERQVDGDASLYVLNQIADVYDNLYARAQTDDEIRQGLPRKYGFHTNVKTKPVVIHDLVKFVRTKAWTERDERALNEMLVYERKPNGAFGAIIGEHDDLLMTRAIGLHICYSEMELPRIVKKNARLSRSQKMVSAASM